MLRQFCKEGESSSTSKAVQKKLWKTMLQKRLHVKFLLANYKLSCFVQHGGPRRASSIPSCLQALYHRSCKGRRRFIYMFNVHVQSKVPSQGADEQPYAYRHSKLILISSPVTMLNIPTSSVVCVKVISRPRRRIYSISRSPIATTQPPSCYISGEIHCPTGA